MERWHLRKSKKYIAAWAFVIIVIGLGAYYAQFLRRPIQMMGFSQIFVIPVGASTQKIAEALNNEGIIQHPLLFSFTIHWQGKRGKLKAGEYLIKSNATPQDLIDIFFSGKVMQHAFTIVPGWTINQLMESLNAEPNIEHTLVGASHETLMEKIGYPTKHPEGRFLPETYHFPKAITDVAFLKRAYELLQEKLIIAWANRAENVMLKTPDEALILASIIEKESACDEEYTEISGVYSRRLEKNHLLQADPTVIYGLGKNFVGSLTSEQLKIDSPYNTYQKLGLPPTPIALPSLKSIEAALHPKPGNSFYFVAKPEGTGHVFSRTLEEHQEAVLEYRKGLEKIRNSGKQ